MLLAWDLLRAQGGAGNGNASPIEQHDDEVDDVATEVNNAREHDISPLFDYLDFMSIVRGCPRRYAPARKPAYSRGTQPALERGDGVLLGQVLLLLIGQLAQRTAQG